MRHDFHHDPATELSTTDSSLLFHLDTVWIGYILQSWFQFIAFFNPVLVAFNSLHPKSNAMPQNTYYVYTCTGVKSSANYNQWIWEVSIHDVKTRIYCANEKNQAFSSFDHTFEMTRSWLLNCFTFCFIHSKCEIVEMMWHLKWFLEWYTHPCEILIMALTSQLF